MVGADTVGGCVEDEHASENGDARQRTSKGELVWRKADNRAAFTNGYETWIEGPDGLANRLNTERFPWEPDTQAVAQAAPTATQTTAPQTAPPTDTPVTQPTASGDASPAPQPTAASTTLPPRPAVVVNLVVGNAPDIGGGLHLGGFSGLAALDRGGTAFVAITDRGPNKDVKVRGDKATAFLVPSYAPSIVKLRREEESLLVVERIPLRLSRGTDPVTGGRNVSGLPNSSRDEPAYDVDGRRALGVDPNGVDPEGIAVDPRDGSYWICEEYGPSILHVAGDGTILSRLVPEGLGLKEVGYDVKEVLPSVLLKHKDNRGFEGVALSPDGQTIFAILQSPLSIPDKSAGEASRSVRLVAIDVSAEPRTTAMYLYQTERFDAVGAREQDDVKIGDLAAITSTRLLVTERDSGASASHRKVYLLELDNASEISGSAFSGKPLEQMSDADIGRAMIIPVAKRLLVDLVGLGFGHELVEGLAVIDDATIAVGNDNNFEDGAPSELMLIRLSAGLR